MPVRTIDIAHPPMHAADAERLLDAHLRELRASFQPQALKVVHGHGGPAVLKETVANWAYRNRDRLAGIIPGTQYAVTDETTLRMRAACGQEPDPDLGRENGGITILWIK
jgi:hypothetical protein